MKDMGEPKHFLRMKIFRDREQKLLTQKLLTQPEYTEKILERFNMKDCKLRVLLTTQCKIKFRRIRCLVEQK